MDGGEKQRPVTCGQDCRLQECAAHSYVMELLHETRGMVKGLSESDHTLKESIVAIVENQKEMGRLHAKLEETLNKIDKRNEMQDEQISKNTSYVNRAIGAAGSISLIAILISAVSAIFAFFLGK